MISGIYRIHFVGGPMRNFGDGIVVFKDGSINGGDVGYIYRGSYQVTESRLAATVNIKQWNSSLPNPVTDISEYHLVIEAPAPSNWNQFTVTARSPEIPALAIDLSATFLGNVA